MVATEIVNGVMRLVQYVKYSNGDTVKRLLDSKTRVPISIIEEKKA